MNKEEMEWFPIDDALEMVLVFDDKGIINYANRTTSTALGYEDDLCGKHINIVFPGTFKETDNGFITEYQFGDEVQKLSAYRKNLTCFPVEARIAPSAKKQGSFICLANNILEREYLSKEVDQVREEAKQAMKVKSEFVANVTHELRTPVNGILGNVRELIEEEKDHSTMKALRLIERCCDDMNKIINNILDFSKLEAGKFVLEERTFDFWNMMDYVKANHMPKITEKGLEFFITVSPNVPEFIVGDELRIVQVLNNLLSNALKFTAVGKISVEVVRTAQIKNRVELFFLVMDSGIGIDQEGRDKLFKSFSQVDASISRKYGGTGLGLNICKQLVELMGGKIAVESEKGKGTTFSFSIWVELPEQEAAQEEEEDTPQLLVMQPTFTPSKESDGQSNVDVAASNEEVEREVNLFDNEKTMEAIRKNLSKLILSVEMDNWEKAEMFMETIKQLTQGAPREIGTAVLRLKMAVQKGNYDKTLIAYDLLKDIV